MKNSSNAVSRSNNFVSGGSGVNVIIFGSNHVSANNSSHIIIKGGCGGEIIIFK